MLADHTTLTRFLIEERRRHPSAVGDLNALILDVSLACKAISRLVAYGELAGALGDASNAQVRAEIRKKLDVSANQIFLQTTEWGGSLAGIISAELQAPYAIPGQHPRGKYLLTFEPLDRSSNIDVNLSVGSIFSILRSPEPGQGGAGFTLPAGWLPAGVRGVRHLRPRHHARHHCGHRRARLHA